METEDIIAAGVATAGRRSACCQRHWPSTLSLVEALVPVPWFPAVIQKFTASPPVIPPRLLDHRTSAIGRDNASATGTVGIWADAIAFVARYDVFKSTTPSPQLPRAVNKHPSTPPSRTTEQPYGIIRGGVAIATLGTAGILAGSAAQWWGHWVHHREVRARRRRDLEMGVVGSGHEAAHLSHPPPRPT
ncbi:hypothetical protein Daus18300_008166 [Diaporthe australafricana]|uniref:Uncharacterized protein n=1 Tax=Diaporthe australafricana TaxID=127596 RepID=A0ABR3WJZ3_9PEZI